MTRNLLFKFYLIFLLPFSLSAQMYNSRMDFEGRVKSISVDVSENIIYTTGKHLCKATNNNQNLIWSKKLTDSSSIDCVETEGNNIYFIGGSADTISNTLYATVTKSGSLGNVLWSKKISYPGDNIDLDVLTVTSDKSVLLGGGACAFSNFIVKLDSLGNLVWAKQYISPNLAGYIVGIQESSDGNVVVAAKGGDVSNFNPVVSLFKINSSGAIIWNKLYEPQIFGNGSQGYSTMKLNSNNEIVYFANYLDANDSVKGVFIKADAFGNVIWCNYYQVNSSSKVWIEDFAFDSNLDIIASGQVNDSNGQPAFFVTKINGSNGENVNVSCSNNSYYFRVVKEVDSNRIILGGTTFPIQDHAALFLVDDIITNKCFYAPGTSSKSVLPIIPVSQNLNQFLIMMETEFIVKFLNSDVISPTYLCSSVLLNEESNELAIDLFPNPSTGNLNIVSKEIILNESIRLIDGLGNIVPVNFQSIDAENYKLELVDIEPGIYFLSGKTESRSSFIKRVVVY